MAQKPPFIMLVDDDHDFLEINRYILEMKGYRVGCFYSRESAFKGMCEEKPDLVVTDLMMDQIDAGFSFSRQIKEDRRFRNVPVIIVTSISSGRGFDFAPRSPEELKAMYADAFFDKPVAPEALLAKIEDLLAGE